MPKIGTRCAENLLTECNLTVSDPAGRMPAIGGQNAGRRWRSQAQKRTRPDAHQKMQDLVTATDMQLHGKHDKPKAMSSYVNPWQATNCANDNIVSQNQGSRRYWGVQADDDFAPTNEHDEQKAAYFVRLNSMVETREGLLAFAHMLYNIDLTGFQPWDKSQRPKTRLRVGDETGN